MDRRAGLIRRVLMVRRAWYTTLAVLGVWSSVSLLSGVPMVRAQARSLSESGEPQDSLPLTQAQEEARQLAIALTNERDSGGRAASAIPLSITVEPALAPGQRPVLPLFQAVGMEGRLLGGQQTLASPVEATSANTVDDANRPLFVPATEAAVAVDLLFE